MCVTTYPSVVTQAQDRSRQFGTQTLARGLNALLAVAQSPAGVTVQEIARTLAVHRSIAYRILQTLSDYGFVYPGGDGLYRAGSRLAALSQSYLPGLRTSALPVMRELADMAGASVALFVAEGETAVAIELVTPITAGHHIAFRQGERTSLDQGAAAYALRATQPPREDEPEQVREVRERGYSITHGEVEAGAHAVAAPISGAYPPACLVLITHLADRARDSVHGVVKAAASLRA